MAYRVLPLAVCAALVLALAGCSKYETARRPAWRTQAEQACLAQGLIRVSAYIQPATEIDGPGICGLTRPFRVSALQEGAVLVNSTSTMACPMVAVLDSWLKEVVQPAALARFAQRVVSIETMGAYSCRTMNNQPGAGISEHAFGNALDIGGFRLADGREISIVRDWTRGEEAARAFLKDVHAGACGYFTTVLGPGSNIFHYNHIHVDLAMHGNTSTGPRRICRPTPQAAPPPQHPRDGLPDAPEIDDEIDIAQSRTPASRALAGAGPGPGPVASVPPAVVMPPRRPLVTAYSPATTTPAPSDPIGRFIAQNHTSRAEGPSDWDLPPPGSR